MSDYEKPSKAEDEYFARQELERRRKWAAEQAAKMATEEKDRIRQQHWMKCPKCGMDLGTIELHGVKVDQCANCGGIFFDKGEVEELLQKDRSGQGGMLDRVFSIFR